jgi:hypothetical protein
VLFVICDVGLIYGMVDSLQDFPSIVEESVNCCICR